MMLFRSEEIERLIEEDVPYFDLTGHILGIGSQKGQICYFTREAAVACGTEEVVQIFNRLGIETVESVSSGTAVDAGSTLIYGRGAAESMHVAWKVSQNILDHCSGIATRTKQLVEKVHSINPGLTVLTTRKGFPGTKKLAVKSILSGGALPHRLGLSETVLVFRQHLNFIGGEEAFLQKLPKIKEECCEKRIIVEAVDLIQARNFCAAGADGIQFDKLPPDKLQSAAASLKEMYPEIVLLAAGGINLDNAEQFASARIDGIVTTSLYSAPPIDIGVRIEL